MFFKDLLALFFIQSIQNEFDIVTLLKKLIFIFVFLSFARIGSAGSSNNTGQIQIDQMCLTLLAVFVAALLRPDLTITA